MELHRATLPNRREAAQYVCEHLATWVASGGECAIDYAAVEGGVEVRVAAVGEIALAMRHGPAKVKRAA